MDNRLLLLARWFGTTPAFVVRYRVWILLLLFIVSLIHAYGLATRTRIDVSTDSLLDRSDPAIAALNSFRTQFGSDDSLFLLYEARDGDVFSAQSLRAVQTVTETLRDWPNLDASQYSADLTPLEQIRRVQSLSTLRIQQVEGDTLRSVRLIPEQLPADPAALAEIRARAMAQDDYRLAFYSLDGRYGAVLIQTTFGARPVENHVQALDAANITLDDAFSNLGNLGFDERASIDDISYALVDMSEYKQFTLAVDAVLTGFDDTLIFYPAGNPSLMSWVFDILEQMLWLAAAVVAIFVFLLRALFRSFSAVVWPIITILMALLWALGFMVWAGATFSTMLSLTVMLVFATGIAGCVHVMSSYFIFRRDGCDHDTAMQKAYEKTGLAILVTTLTTMAGVLALAISDLIPVRIFGITSALGVFMTLVFTMVLMPILLSFWHPHNSANKQARSNIRQGWNNLSVPVQLAFALMAAAVVMLVTSVIAGPALGLYLCALGLITLIIMRWEMQILAVCPKLAIQRPRSTIAVFSAIFIASLYGTSQVKIDSNIAELAHADSAPRIAFGLMDEHMAGAQNIAIMIDTGVSDGITEPAVLNAMSNLQTLVAERYSDSIARSYSLANIVKDTYQVMNQGDAAFYRIPDSSITVSQLLYLFSSANPEERRSLVSDDFSRSHISLSSYNAGSYAYQQLTEELNKDLDTIFSPLVTSFPELQVTVTGSIPVMMRAMDEIAQSQYSSLLIALAVISAIMIVTLGSVQAGMISIVPNLIPALMTFGLMGILDITLDADTLLIAPVIISVAVDDTIHFMTSYRLELLRTRSMQQALDNTLRSIGRAVMFTTLILGLGFAVLGFSEYLGIAKIGIFGGLAIVMALLCDLLLLPAILMVFKPRFGIKGDIEGFGRKERLAHEFA